MPRRLRAGFLSLPEKGPDPSLDNGNIVSEVGPPETVFLDCYNKDFLCYNLRKHRKYRTPMHVFGKMYLGGAYSAFTPDIVTLPAVGTRNVINPLLTPEQIRLISMYRYVNGDVYWIIHVPAPLGVGVLIEVFAPELDSSTTTRSVRFRPSGVTTIAVSCPWSNDLTMVPTGSGRVGQSGGALGIRIVEDNTTDQVNTPLNITLYCCVTSVVCTSKIVDDFEGNRLAAFNFTPQPDPPTPEVSAFVEHGDDEEKPSAEVTAEGVAELHEQNVIDDTPASEIAVPAEEPVGKPTVPKGSRSTKNQTGIPGARWIEAMTFTIGPNNFLVWQNLTLDPRNLTARGENISLAYRRNVWVSGSEKAGYARTLKTKIIITRPPSISGVIEVQDSRNNSSRYLVEFGGNVEVDLMLRNHAGVAPQARPRYYNNRFVRTDEAQVDWRYRVTGFNRTSDIADVSVRVLVRQGNAYFDVPTKPRPQATTLGWLVEEFKEFTEKKDLQYLAGEEIRGFIEHGDEDNGNFRAILNAPRILNTMARDDQGNNNYDSEQFVTAEAGEGGYYGETNPGGAFNEDIDQDNFAVEIWRGMLPVGAITTIPLNLSLVEDESGTGGLSTIAQKFQRFAHVVASKEGNLGPQIGSYTIDCRLPTTIAGQISHVSLPGDMLDEAAVFAFGLGDILSMATSALQAVGGPALSAGISAGRAIFDVIKSIGGKTSEQSNSDTANMPSLSGPIDISRFVNLLKPVLTNELADPTFGALLVQARDFIDSAGIPLTEIPARVWARMNDAQVERSVFDRLLTPSNTMVNEVRIPYDRWSYLVDLFGSHPNTFKPGTHQNTCWLKFMSLVRKHAMKQSVTSLSLKEILEYEVSEEDADAIDSILVSKRLTLLP